MNPETLYWLTFSSIVVGFVSVICYCGYSCLQEVKGKKLQIETLLYEV